MAKKLKLEVEIEIASDEELEDIDIADGEDCDGLPWCISYKTIKQFMLNQCNKGVGFHISKIKKIP